MTQDSKPQGSDPVGDFQRWLMRSGARGLGREMRGNIRKTFGYGEAGRDDVWESATNEPEGGESPECEWCPLCRAARKMRESGPGLGSHLASAGGVFATVVQDAVNAFEAVIATGPGAGRSPADPHPGRSPADPGAGRSPADAGAGPSPADPGAGSSPADPGAGSSPADPGAGSSPADAGAASAPGDPGAPADPQATTGEPPEGPAGGPVDRS
jgi:hypothetical protein